ncbi:MAG TPA: heparinase II/III family protein [Bryobacteraceae bacterium]|nr:heparinase II/III family protein [Bryobacteraceae bacterium]
MQPTRRQFVGTAALLANVPALPAEERPSRALISGATSPESLERTLLPRREWKPFPTAGDRARWDNLPQDTRRALIEAGERNLHAEWPQLPATEFLEYARTGNRSHFESLQFARRQKLRDLALAECVEGKGRFLDDIVNGLWATCEETFWGVPAHLGAQKAGTGLPDAAEPTVDLFASETAALLAWTGYLMGPAFDTVSPLVRPRLNAEIERRVLEPNRTRDDFWWMGLTPATRQVNNWNPWINSNWLTCSLLLEDDSRRSQTVHKILRSLDRFLDGYHDDGGCDEGPSYWSRAGGSLFDCLELLSSASAGRLDYFRVPLVGEIGRYIYRAHIHNDYFVNFADASAKPGIPGDLVFRYGRRIGDEKLQGLGAFAAEPGHRSGDSMGRQLAALFDTELPGAQRFQPLVRDVWLPGLQVMAARAREGSAEGLYLAAKGGHNAESHNHNDVGNFVVYAGGEPAIIDVGVETYTAKTFSSRRYDIWTMQSAYHNLPTIGGVMQSAGREFAASEVEYRSGADAAEFSLNIAGAYPAEAGVGSWHRTLRLDRAANRILVEDRYALRKAVPQIALTLMTPQRPVVAAGEVTLGAVHVLFDRSALTAAVEEIAISDARLRGAWGDRLFRVQLTAAAPPRDGTFTLTIKS